MKNRLLYKSSCLVLLILIVTLASIIVLAQEDSDKYGGSITIPHDDVSLPVMDAHQGDDLGEVSIGFLVSDPLLRLVDGEYIPLLAKDWDISEDGQSYTLYIREGVKFHNNKVLTAEIVKKNIERIIDNALARKGYLSDIENVEVLDDYVLKINLKNTSPFFLINLTQVHILEPSTWEDYQEGDPVVGTGPFMYVPEEYSPESGMELRRFDDYWRGKPYLDKINVKIVGSKEATLIQLRKGVVDVAESVNFKDVKLLEKEGFKIYKFGKVNWASIAINLSTVELPVRKAINYAFNKEAVLNAPTVFAGYGLLQYSIGYPGSYLYNDEVGYHYDPEKAKEILKEAGWVDLDGDGIREKNGKKLDLFFPTRTGMGWENATQMIKQMLQEVGIGSHIKIAPSSTFYSMVRTGDYDIAWWLSNDVSEPPIATYQFNAERYWCVTQVAWDDLQNLLKEAQGTIDRDKQAKLYKKIQEIHYEQAMEALGIWTKQIHVTSSKLSGFKVTSNGDYYNSYRWYVK